LRIAAEPTLGRQLVAGFLVERVFDLAQRPRIVLAAIAVAAKGAPSSIGVAPVGISTETPSRDASAAMPARKSAVASAGIAAVTGAPPRSAARPMAPSSASNARDTCVGSV